MSVFFQTFQVVRRSLADPSFVQSKGLANSVEAQQLKLQASHLAGVRLDSTKFASPLALSLSSIAFCVGCGSVMLSSLSHPPTRHHWQRASGVMCRASGLEDGGRKIRQLWTKGPAFK